MEASHTETLEKQLAHQAAIAANFHTAAQPFLLEEAEIALRQYQPVVLQELDTFMVDTGEEVGRRILIPQPPNFGKSFMSVLCMDLAGVGKPVPETGQPLQGLFLTPRRIGIRQALETSEWLTPHLKTGAYDSSEPNGSKWDLLAMTYRAVDSMSEDEWLEIVSTRDILALDEAHRAIGPKMAARLALACEATKPTILAASATPKFNDEHTVAGRLNIQRATSSITEREAIHLGVANEVHLLALYSGEEISFNSARSSITESDTLPLIEREGRNRLIVDTMADLAANGRTGIVQLVPGEESKHARMIAAMARERKIIDPYTGAERPMRVEAVGTFQSKRKNDHMIEALKKGQLDALTFTKYLLESLDCPNGLGYVFNAAPLGGEVDIRQLSGRGSRFFPLPTILLSLVDKYSGSVHKRIRSFFDVYGEHVIRQGVRISKRKAGNSRIRTKSPKKIRHPSQQRQKEEDLNMFFSESVQEALDAIPRGTLLDELLITRARLEGPPEGYIHLGDLPSVRQGLMTEEGARHILAHRTAEDGRPLFLNAREGMLTQFVLGKEAEDIISSRVIRPGNVTRMEIANFLEGLGWPRPTFSSFVQLCKESGAEYKTVGKGINLEPSEVRKALLMLAETPPVDPELELSIAGIARIIKSDQTGVYFMSLIRRNRHDYEAFLRTRRKGSHPPYKKVEAMSLEGIHKLLLYVYENSPANRKAIGKASLISTIITNAQTSVRDFYEANGIRPSSLTKEVINAFLSPYEEMKQQASEAVSSPSSASITRNKESVPEASMGQTPDPTTNAATPPLPPRPLDSTYLFKGYGEDWVTHAACADADEDLFFSHETLSPRRLRAAKSICGICPVKGECLKLGVKDKSHGIFGGMTEDERKMLGTEVHEWLSKQTF